MKRIEIRAVQRMPIVCVLTVVACIAIGGAAANAKPGPTAEITKPDFENTPAAWSMHLGPAGAMLEADYFSAPRVRAGRILPCRLERDDQGVSLRLAHACLSR